MRVRVESKEGGNKCPAKVAGLSCLSGRSCEWLPARQNVSGAFRARRKAVGDTACRGSREL